MGYSCRLHIHLRGKNERSSGAKLRANELKVVQWNLVVAKNVSDSQSRDVMGQPLGKGEGAKKPLLN